MKSRLRKLKIEISLFTWKFQLLPRQAVGIHCSKICKLKFSNEKSRIQYFERKISNEMGLGLHSGTMYVRYVCQNIGIRATKGRTVSIHTIFCLRLLSTFYYFISIGSRCVIKKLSRHQIKSEIS